MNMHQRIRTKLKLTGEELHGAVDIDEYIEEKLLFRLFFLTNNEDQSVEVMEAEVVDFTEVKKRLEGGESVFISHENRLHLDLSKLQQKTRKELGTLLVSELI